MVTVAEYIFDDYHLAERVAEELDGVVLYAWDLNRWHVWDSQRWAPSDVSAVRGLVGKWLSDRYHDAAKLAAGTDPANAKAVLETLGRWRVYCNGHHIKEMTELLKFHVRVHSSEFDQHPDLITFLSGVYDGRTGEIGPHDPGLMLTQVTKVDYVPGATHPDFTRACECLPPDILDWLQVRLGQAMTGYIAPDDKNVFLTGAGRNGKGTLMTGLANAAGDYFLAVSERAVVADSAGSIPTELAAFRGKRFAWLDELPDDRLSSKRLKDLAGCETMSARGLHQDAADSTFTTTHSLFISTNFGVKVYETDDGTWERVIVVPFTRHYTADPSASHEHAVDTDLRTRLTKGKEQQEAALAWLIAGARRWYDAGKKFPAPPLAVIEATEEERRTRDHILRFCEDMLVPDPSSTVIGVEILAVYNRWLTAEGNQSLSASVFKGRFGAHGWVTHNQIKGSNNLKPDNVSHAAAKYTDKLYLDPPGKFRGWSGVRFREEADRNPVACPRHQTEFRAHPDCLHCQALNLHTEA